jgi:hypothetical protein
LDPNNPQDRAEADAIVAEYRTMIQFEAAWRAGAEIKTAEAAEAQGERVDWNAVAARVQMQLQRGEREAASITYDAEVNRIVVGDVYGAERLEGSGRSTLGGSVYERLLYLSRHVETVHVGFFRPTEAFRRAHSRDEQIVGGASPEVGYRDGYVRVVRQIAWALPSSMRGPGFVADPSQPTYTTITHETVVHPFRRFAQMADADHVRHTGSGNRREDNGADRDGHFLFQVAGDDRSYPHPEGGAWSAPDDPNFYLEGPTVDFFVTPSR